METSGLSASDVLALTRENDGFLGGSGNGFIILILFLLMLSGGFGWSGNRGYDCASKADLYESANAQNTFSEFRSLQNETTRGFGDVNQHLCNGFANVNQNISGNFANTNMGIAKGFYDQALGMNCGFNGVQAAIADTNYRMQNCCCDIEKKIAKDGEATRNLIQQNEIQRLREELQDAKNENLATGLVTAQGIQTQNLMEFFRKALNGGCCGY